MADMDGDKHPARPPISRVVGVLLLAGLAAVLVASSTAAASPPKERDHPAGQAQFGCHGIANAYSHVSAEQGRAIAALRAVAAKHGCDLSGVEPASHPTDEDTDDSNDDQADGPPAEVVARKCDKISEKLSEAQARPHGHSADAFARQAEKWGCLN